MLFHELRHVEANQRLLRTKEKFCEAAGNFGLADAGGTKEEEATDGTRGVFQTGAAAANGARERGDGFVLADDALVQLGFNAQELLLLVFLDGSYSDARPAGDDFLNVLAGDDAGGSVVQLVAFAEAAKIFLFLAFFFGIEAGFFEFVRGDGAF